MEEGGGKKGKMSGEFYSATILSVEREERMRGGQSCPLRACTVTDLQCANLGFLSPEIPDSSTSRCCHFF